jgi:hypothetical protein
MARAFRRPFMVSLSNHEGPCVLSSWFDRLTMRTLPALSLEPLRPAQPPQRFVAADEGE